MLAIQSLYFDNNKSFVAKNRSEFNVFILTQEHTVEIKPEIILTILPQASVYFTTEPLPNPTPHGRR